MDGEHTELTDGDEMTELEKTILGADDEYLAAISNKGILKRGYADLEKTEPFSAYIQVAAYYTSYQVRNADGMDLVRAYHGYFSMLRQEDKSSLLLELL